MKLEYYGKIILTTYVHKMYCSATSFCESHGLPPITNAERKKKNFIHGFVGYMIMRGVCQNWGLK